MRPPQLIEHALRRALSGPKRQEVAQALGWDNSAMSRFLNGDQGVTIDKIDILVRLVGYMLVTCKYLDAIAVLGEVGMSCECARQGLGECGRTLE